MKKYFIHRRDMNTQPTRLAMQDLPDFLADKKFVPEKQRNCCLDRVRHAFPCFLGCSKNATAIHTFQELPGQAHLRNTLASAQVPGCTLLGGRNPLDW